MNKNLGQSMIEYIILVAIVAVASLGIVKILGNTIHVKLSQITLALQGKKSQARSLRPHEVQPKHYEPKSLEDFYESED
ncbi:MAG: hypothetical protein HY390_06280 [Deltaproteobacteria bacterium]|nr:hypothetical protein [Deltaproteobacteria bacterium]